MEFLKRKEGFVTMVVPIGTVTAGYGSLDSVHKTPHTGIDFYAPLGSEVYTPIDGLVSRIVETGNRGLGKGVFIQFQDGKQMVFGHLSQINVRMNETVHRGDLIGLSGNTGNSTGPHLHFGIIDQFGHFIDPVNLFKQFYAAFNDLTSNTVTAFVSVSSDLVSMDFVSTLISIIPIAATSI